MSSKRAIVLYWALFLIPAVILAAAALELLDHEQDRLNRRAAAALIRQAEAAADGIDISIEAVQDTLIRSLEKIPAQDRLARLKSWEASNPLIRYVFITSPDLELQYPESGAAATTGEQTFIDRYDALFSGRLAFDFNQQIRPDRPADPTGIVDSESYGISTIFSRSWEKQQMPAAAPFPAKSSRRELVDMARNVPGTPPKAGTHSPAPVDNPPQAPEDTPFQKLSAPSGWIPWFNENRLYILGWVQDPQNGSVYGVELELMTLLSRLVVDFPALKDPHAALVLKDGNDRFMHQSGGLAVDPEDLPFHTLGVSPRLPHWRISIYTGPVNLVSTRGFLILSLILLGIFLAAIITGGTLLTRLTLKNMKDARQKTSFVSSVSHELKTPLTSIRMYAELLQTGKNRHEEKTARYLSIIVTETQRLTRLINNVLDFSRLEQGKKRYHPVTVDLFSFLEQVIEAHRPRIRQGGFSIQRHFENRQMKVMIDPDALEQVILNLVDNALKYAAGGSFIRFEAAFAPPGSSSACAEIRICDDGPGIPSRHRKAVFDRFHRVDSSLTARKPGSGLGLTISRKIIRDMGGDLVLDTDRSTGCCFIITGIPLGKPVKPDKNG